MTSRAKWTSLGVSWLFVLAVSPAQAQVASLGKGWLLDSGGSITSAPGEVISGRNSIKASGTSPVGGFATSFLGTDPTFVSFSRNQSYTIAFSYRIITADGGGFGYAFESSESGLELGLDDVLRGASGSSGTVTTTFRLNNHGDYRVRFSIDGRGSIVIDDVRITASNGQLVASENAEGPSLAPGPLNFQVTDAIALLTPAQAVAVSAAAKDLDGDGYPETILTLATPRPTTTPLEPIVIEASDRMRVATADFFPAGAPTIKDSPMTLFADINNDGLTDILFADAGSDAEPFPGSRIGVALNIGGGKYRDVSSLIPADQQTTRSYAIAVGDIFGDGRVEIILPDQNRGANTALLRWNGNGFDEIRDWIPQSIWSTAPALLNAQSWMSLADFDRDGRLDLLVTGQDHNPNFQIVFGGPGGFTAGTLVVLPDGPFGHTQGGPQPDGTLTTLEVTPAVVADFNNDGLPDIFATFASVTLFTTGCPTANPCRFGFGDMTYAVRLNQGARRFIDASPSPYVNLGRIAYQNLMAIDINNDGFLDVVGTYVTDTPPGTSPQWGTTLFLNDGTGAFQLVDGAQFIGATTTPPNGNRWGLGLFVPTVISPGRTEGIVYQSVGGCGTPGGCPATGLNLFKVVANRALGTGPDFADSASLGVPGFNEFYYLRHYPDAAAAVQGGEYANGLAHYRAVGKALGSRSHAPSAKVTVTPASLQFGATYSNLALPEKTRSQTVRIEQTGIDTVTWTAASNQPWLTVTPVSGTGSATLTINVIEGFVFPASGTSRGSITLAFTGASNTAGPITVDLTTKPIGTGSSPFGLIDTPADGTTGVAGSIAVTGWALDDIEVRQVRILRDPVIGESPAQVFIGNAVFVDGSRPDVATLNSNVPLNRRAGWGYLMLTNFLPNQGNGTFRIYAYANDAEGHTTLLGSTTITCTNTTSTRPFGAIDTPAQGETIDGTSYANFGWVLARGTTKAYPPYGTVRVLIDGVFGPSPTGWASRPDLTTLFPATTYSGVTNALGVFAVDTTALSNGVHTIAWVVTADNGQADGIGSRYFTVANSSELRANSNEENRPGATTGVVAGTIGGLPRDVDTVALDRTAIGARGGFDLTSPLTADVDAAPIDRTPILGRRGFDLDAPLRPLPVAASGRATMDGEELDRFELHLDGQSSGAGGAFTGYMRVGDELGPLPIGSHLDSATGTFTWHPGPGFLHAYDLVFVRWSAGRAVARQDVRLVIAPKGTNRVGPQVVIDTPWADASIAQPFVVAGWAIDPDSWYDTGIDTLHVWAYPASAPGAPIFLGATAYGGTRPDVGAIFGERFRNSGYGLIVDSLPAGTYDLAVFAWSTASGGFVPARVVRITVQ